MMLNEKLLSTSEAAEFLGISKHTLNSWKSQRRVPFVKLGRRTLFDPDVLADFIESCTVKPKQSRLIH